MIEITRCYGAEDVIITDALSQNVVMDKKYKLSRKQKKLLLWSFRVYQLDGVSREDAGRNLLHTLEGFMPRKIRGNFSKYLMARNIIWDVKQILTSDNVELDLVRYFVTVCGLSLIDLASDSQDKRVYKWYGKFCSNFVA